MGTKGAVAHTKTKQQKKNSSIAGSRTLKTKCSQSGKREGHELTDAYILCDHQSSTCWSSGNVSQDILRGPVEQVDTNVVTTVRKLLAHIEGLSQNGRNFQRRTQLERTCCEI